MKTLELEETAVASFAASGGSAARSYYKDALVEIINADAREIMHTLPRGLVVTDPPYNVGYHYEDYTDNLSVDDYQAMLRETCPLPCVILHYAEDLCAMAWTLEELPQKMVAWVYPSNTARQWRGIGWWGCKPDFDKEGQDYKNPNDKRIAERIARGERARLYDWWEIDQVKNVGSEKTAHPCQIPTEVMRRILKITDCQLVIDPFCGSGTTLVAAKQLGIRAIGIERNKNYCELAAMRVSQEMALVPPNESSSPMTTSAPTTPDCQPATARAGRHSVQRLVRHSHYEIGCFKRAVRGRVVHIHTTPPRALEDRHGYTKHGHGRHYIAVGEHFDTANTIDMAWDRRCDASRWAKRARALEICHWRQI